MRSHAAIGRHPLHPALVAVPIGAFALTFLADLFHLGRGTPETSLPLQFAQFALLAGVISSLVAAGAGFIDYFSVEMSQAGRRVATRHMVVNLVAVTLFALSLWVRVAEKQAFLLAFVCSTAALLVLSVGGWLGGKMVFEHKVGVIETADPEAARIGAREEMWR
jgi:uncharacterized membrane protein